MFQGYRGWWILGLSAWAGVAGLFLALALVATRSELGVVYPGALKVADDTRYDYRSSLNLRRITTYRTHDDLSTILTWYSSEFELGEVVRPQGGCIVTGKTMRELFVVERRLSVALCETPNGQTITVRRSWLVQWR